MLVLVMMKIHKLKMTEPMAQLEADGAMTRAEEIKFSKKYDRYLTNMHKINNETKQVIALLYRQIDDDMKSCLKEKVNWDDIQKHKKFSRLLKMLQNVNFSYHTNQEPILFMCNTKHDFMKISHGKYQTVQEYCHKSVAIKEFNESISNIIHKDTELLKSLQKNLERWHTLSLMEREDYKK